MRVLSKLRSPWTVSMVGAIVDSRCDPVLVMEYLDLGSLHSLLHNATIDVDQESMRMMILDIVQGCRFLHAADPPVVHGDLKSMVRGGVGFRPSHQTTAPGPPPPSRSFP